MSGLNNENNKNENKNSLKSKRKISYLTVQ